MMVCVLHVFLGDDVFLAKDELGGWDCRQHLGFRHEVANNIRFATKWLTTPATIIYFELSPPIGFVEWGAEESFRSMGP